MKVYDTPYLRNATLMALVTAGIGYAVLPPFYETGAAKYYVPLLSLLDFFLAYSLIRNLLWLKSWIRGLSIGWLLVAVPFWGRSSEFHGELAMPMLIVESLSVLAGLGLLLLSFDPTFRKPRLAS
jgi:hypothetical protein